MKKSLASLFAGGAVLALSLSACGSGSVDGGSAAATSSGAHALTHVKIGLFPSSAVGAFQLGIDKGFFADHGIDLELVMGQSSAAQLPAVNSGALDFVLASPTTPIVADSKGLDLKIVAGFAKNDPKTVTDSVAVLVGKGSPIKSAKDLEGKKVAINAVGSIGEIGIKEAVEKDGGDPNKVTFVQLGFDQVAAQLASGQIDAGMAGPPFMQQILGAGGAVVSDFIQAADLGGAELVIVSGGKTVEQKPKMISDFDAALTDTLTYAQGHVDEVRNELPKVLGTPPAAAAKTDFDIWDAHLDVEAIKQFETLMVKFKVIDSKPDLSKLVYSK